MDDWKRILSILLLPLNLCGAMLLMASRSLAIHPDRRWQMLVLGMVLLIPGISFMILTLPLSREHDGEGDESENLDSAHPGCDVESLAIDDRAQEISSYQSDPRIHKQAVIAARYGTEN